jgi:pyruvate dehydrogenase E1 component beta subunit
MHVPGIKVITPSTPYDIKGLLKSAIRDNNIVICFEHKKLYGMKGEVPEEEYTIPLGKADIKRKGRDVTLVTYAYMTHFSLEAADRLAAEGIDAEVIDLRTLDPLDEETILESVRKTHRLVIVQEPWRQASVSSEIAALVADRGLYYLDAPIKRVTMKDTPVPFSPVLENFILPQVDDIVGTVKSILA